MTRSIFPVCILLSLCLNVTAAETSILPEGEAKSPIQSGHFPDRLYEYVWRNWNAVEAAKLGKIIGASAKEITAIAESMGLPPAAAIPPEQNKRGYITLIRRNWHLLPYEQLLELVEMTPERLAFALREDDFLWIKLGSVKPRSEPLHYQPPSQAARQRAAEIKRVVENDFGAAIRRPAQPRFEFVRKLSTPTSSPPTRRGENEPLRMVYSYLAVYGDPLMNPDLDPFPEGLLERCSAVGINGIWLHAVLRELAPGGDMFPEFGVDHETRLANLRTLVKKAARHGIGVHLYLNEPRAMPEAFYQNRPELAGVHKDGFATMCTSQPAVREWMTNALAYIFSNVPDLAGVFTMTASENLTNCASHGGWRNCPRCKDRTDAEIIAEVNAAMQAGVHRGNPRARVIISDWGWRGHGDAPDIVELLPKSAWLMSVSEWSKPIQRGGIETKVGEYSISSPGPGPRAPRHWEAARKKGLKTAAEIQFNNTCEIASVPYIPVMDLIAEHIKNLLPAKLDGMMIGWTMGGHPSPNFDLVRRLTSSGAPDAETVLNQMARERFGEGAPHARRAWTLMSDAFREYPFHVSVVYTSPVQIGPANPLYLKKTDYRATMWGIPYDDVERWRGPYPPGVFAAQFEKMAAGWRSGVEQLQLAVDKAPAERRDDVADDLRFARVAGLIFQSVANQTRFVVARDILAAGLDTIPAGERKRLLSEMKRSLESEIVLARELFPLASEDSRVGFEPSCHHFYLPLDLVEKVVNCRWLLKELEHESSAL